MGSEMCIRDRGRENLTFYYDVPAEALREGFVGQGEASGEDH